jgi:hypothetical protein
MLQIRPCPVIAALNLPLDYHKSVVGKNVIYGTYSMYLKRLTAPHATPLPRFANLDP